MGFIKFLRGKLSQIPEEIVDGQVYLAKNTKGLYVDVETERLRLNPPSDWNETNRSNPAYIANKPTIGSVASRDVASELNQQETIPTSKLVYNAIRDLRSEFANAQQVEGPRIARGIAEMTDTSKVYVYVGTESGMNNGHWYWSNGQEWQDGGVYNATVIDTDPTLLIGGKAADAAATGNFINELKGETDDLYAKVNTLTSDLEQLNVRADSFFNDLDVTSEGLVYGVQDGNRLNGPYGPFAGNGGGGGGGGGGSMQIDAVFTATNNTEWNTATIADGDDIDFVFTWESIENDVPSGRGTVTITVNNIIKATLSVPQGENTINLRQYYSSGANKIRIRISDQYDQAKQWIVNLNVVQLVISSTFDTSFAFTDQITVPYTPVGNVNKTIYFKLDGEVVGTNTTSVSGRMLTYMLPQQSHGAHTLEMYFTAEINGQTVYSNTLHYEFIAIRSGETEVIIVSPFNQPRQKQYSSVVIPYTVYDPVNINPEVSIYVNDVLVSTQTVNQSQQTFTYKANVAGAVEIKIASGETEKVITLNIQESDIHIEAETEGLELYLNSSGRSNNEETKDVWEYGDIQAEMTNFGWRTLDGWINDDDGVTVLRTIGDARVYIPFKPFIRNFVETGKTIEIEFATHNVVDYTAPIISCMYDGVGFEITPQTITFNSTQVQLMTPFKDNEHVRVTVVVHSQSNNRLILFYVNGIMSSAVQYPADDSFSQGANAVGISIGSNLCSVDIYTIRVYRQDLNREQVITNWIADTQVGDLMIDRYRRNNIFDNGVINTNTLPSNLPYWIINAVELPQYKGDKKTVTLSYTDPLYPAKSFTAEGVSINVQGTSSQAYFRKNYDLQFKKGFNLTSGYADNYTIIDAIPFNRFVLKADVASSESTNNTKLTMYYNELCPYKTPEMIQDPKVRWGIEGKPCVVFWYNPDTGITEFLGKANFNLPKRAPGPYGYSGNDESWEVERNNSANVQFQDTDFTTQVWDDDDQKYKPEWYDDWEARFPDDTWRETTKLNAFVGWVKSTWTEEATNENLPEPITFNLNTLTTLTNYSDDESYTVVETTSGNSTTYNITFTKDTPAYRLTKFRAEAPDYMEIESATFYYLYTLFFLMIDSRAKNMFFGFHGSPATNVPVIERKVVFEPYDMDTGLGTNNSGVLKFGYYHLDTDTVSSIISGGDESDSGKEAPVFNGQGSVLWSNFREAFRPEYGAMYRNLRAGNLFNYEYIENMYEEHQAMWPEALFNEDSYVKYLVPLVEDVTFDEDTQQFIKTDRYLTMLQGSKEQQRKWWLQNRFRYFDSMFTVGSAETSFIEMRLFNSGTLTITPSQDMYVAVRFGRGSTTQRTRATAGEPVSFQYTVREGMTVTEMESTIFSANLIADVGDLSGFYGNEFDFSKATRLRRLKLGDSSPTYNNANLQVLNVSNCYLLEEIDCRNCNALTAPISLDGSPMLGKAYFDGTKVSSVSFVPGAPLTNVHLPSTITSLILIDHTNLTDFQCPSLENVSTLMLENIHQNALDPMEALSVIKPGSRINIQGLYMEVVPDENDVVVEVPVYDENDNVIGTETRTLTTDAEKADYVIEQFLDTIKNMKGVQRERNTSSGSSREAWIYHDVETPIISGLIHTTELTGDSISRCNAAYPYLRVDADRVESKRYYMSEDGSTQIAMVTCVNGKIGSNQTPPSTVVASATTATDYDGAKYTYGFLGWSTRPNSAASNVDNDDERDAFKANHYFYAVFSRTLRSYTIVWKNYDNTTLEIDSNVPYGTVPTYDGAAPMKESQQSNGWEPEISAVTGDIIYTATYKPVYTATFLNDNGTQIATVNVIEGKIPVYNGEPTSSKQVNEGDYEFTGWSPALAPVYGNVSYTAVYDDNRPQVVKYLMGELTEYEGISTEPIMIRAFNNQGKLTRVKTASRVIRNSFQNCNALNTMELTYLGQVTLDQNAFSGPKMLQHLIIRSTTIATLANTTNVFVASTAIKEGAGVVYVPENILTDYQGNSNWANYNLNIMPISEYPYDIIQAKWSQAINSISYFADYAIGDTLPLIIGNEIVNMELVAINADDKADGSGKARMTWICKRVPDIRRKMTDSGSNANGWAEANLRNYIREDIFLQLPNELKESIVPVNKTYYDATSNSTKSIIDTIWIPSAREIFGTENYEDSGVIYDTVFKDANSRRKYTTGGGTAYWVLRSATKGTSNQFRNVDTGGYIGNSYANASNIHIVIGFCI